MNPRSASGILITFLALLLATLHRIAMAYFLYWRFWWFDIPMHILAGIFFGAAFSWLARFELPERMRRMFFSFVPVVLSVFLVGVAWELFEFVFHIGGSAFMPYGVDTAKDIADDVIGGAVGYALIRMCYGER